MSPGGRHRQNGMTSEASDLPWIGKPATNALAVFGVTRLKQLVDYTEAEIADLHGVGPKAIGILTDALGRRGLAFAARSHRSP